MLNKILKINPSYFILLILCFFVIMISFKKKNVKPREKKIAVILYLFVAIFSFSYINGIISSIFKLEYLSVKMYLILVVLINAIMLFTINKDVKLVYKILNYSLFILITIIFGATVAIIIGNKNNNFYLMDVSNAINLIDLSMVIFILYLICLCLTYIGYSLFEDKQTRVLPLSKEKTNVKLKITNWLSRKFIKNKKSPQKKLISKDQLLNFDREKKLYISGEECNIIFEDSNRDNIYKNYQILSQDIHARMMNGYTLKENKMLKSICIKLQVNSLANIDISNLSILNKISIEEYMLLKEVFGVK